MGFLKSVFGRGDKGKPPDEPAPTQADVDEALDRLKQAVSASPHKATSDIANAASSLYEIYSKIADESRVHGDMGQFVFNVAQGADMYTMAAQAFYGIGCTKKGIDALEIGLQYAREALAKAPSSAHFASINKERNKMETLLNAFEQVQREGEDAVLRICTEIREAGVQATNNGDPIWKMKGLRPYVLALSDAISELTYCIIVPGGFGPYVDVWRQDTKVFWDLASFLGYFLAIHTLPTGQDAKRRGDSILPVVASIWQPTDRVHSMIERYHDLMSSPQEMKERRILWAHPNSADSEARNVVYEFIVNELINGPDLGGGLEDPERLDPADSFYLKLYLQDTLLLRIDTLRAAAAYL